MSEFQLPEYPELFSDLSEIESTALMHITTGAQRVVETTLLRAFAYAVENKASDVHINAYQTNDKRLDVRISIRTPISMDNLKYDQQHGKHFETKMLALTNTPQGGSTPDLLSTRFSMQFPAWWAAQHGLGNVDDKPYEISVRVEHAKTFSGWTFVNRIINQQTAPSLSQLELSASLETLIRRIIQEPSGLILVTGPTGSGKTTLLNAIINELNNGQNAIITIENPVEYILKGDGPIKQIQVHGEVTFAKALRSALRQDPDIILIGEIRDVETMDVALEAASTGHLVLTTLHSNSATDAASRALDLLPDRRRDAVRLADSLKMIIAQRLVHKFEAEPGPRPLGNYEKSWLKDNGLDVIHPLHETVSTKQLGKAALIEAIEITYPISQIIRGDVFDSDAMYRIASQQLQYETLVMAGLRAVEEGWAKLNDCRAKLETNRSAGVAPPLRTALAQKYNLSYKDVARGIDTYTMEQDQNKDTTLEATFERMFK